MSGSNVAHVSSVDKGLKMKIKRTKVPNKVDSKHEVVKPDSLLKSTATPAGQSAATAMPDAMPLPSTIPFSSSSSAVATSAAVAGNPAAFIHASSVSSSLAPPMSASSLASSSSMLMTSQLVTVANPTVALLKAVSAGVIADAYSGNSISGHSKSPLKSVPLGAPGPEAKDGKSPKTKAAYSKKAKDNKGKTEVPVASSPVPPVGGPNLSHADSRTSITVTSGSPTINYGPSGYPPQAGIVSSTMTSEPRPGDTVHMKRENPVHDPYEFNAKVEDKIELPPKKLKVEKIDCIETAISPQPQQQQQHHQHSSPTAMLQPPAPPQHHHHHHHHHQQQPQQPQKRSIGVDVCSVGVVTEPESLGPCEPGTSVGLEGIVWKETDNGLLVVNVTWRGKTYVGTLMDATRYAWAPPRPNGCESPVSDFESRTPKGRGKRTCRSSAQSSEKLQEGRRLRKGRRGTVNSSSSSFTAPPSPAKSDISTSNMKRKARPNDLDSEKSKRSRSCSRGVTGAESPTPDGYIVCPEPNCHKKYKHMNGLRYHRTHAHRKSSLTDDVKDEEEEEDEEEEKPEKKEKTSSSDRDGRMKAKEKQRMKEQQRVSDRDSKDSVDDDIPLKEIASKASSQVSDHKVDNAVSAKERAENEPGGNNNDESCVNVTAASVVSSKVEPQVVLTKTNIHLQADSGSPATVISTNSKKKDVDVVDETSTAASAVPSMPSTSESPVSVVVNSSSSNMDVPVITTARSQMFNSTPTSSVSGIRMVNQAGVSFVAAHTTPINPTTLGQTGPAVPTPLQAVTLPTDRQNSGKNSGFVKALTAVRPIVPALPPQIAALSSQHSQNPTSASSVQAHGFTLKPIQPKPTIMGDYSLVNPALSDLSKDKSRKPKKKKDNSSTVDQSTCGSKGQIPARESNSILSDTVSQDDAYKCERSAVIKNPNPSKSQEVSSPSSDVSKLPFQSLLNSPKLQSSVNSESPAANRSRIVIPPSTLPVACTTDNKSTMDDDVHSPAYSDISDANDSNSPFQHDSPKKETLKKDSQVGGPSLLPPDGSALSQHYGNMFYYGAPSNYLPHGINSQMSSPTLSDGLLKKDDIDVNRPSSAVENSQDKKEDSRSIQEAELQQKSVINYFAHLHGMSPATVQLQFDLAGYSSSAMDSPYALLEQQKRLLHLHDMAVKSENASGKRTPSTVPPTIRPMGSGCESTGRSVAGAGSQLDQKRTSDDRDLAHKDKNTDSQQSVDLKSQLGLHQEQNYHLMKQQHQQQNDLLRVQMYQQQKQKMYEAQRQDKHKGPPELTSLGSQSLGMVSRHPPDIKTQELLSHDMIKKETMSTKDISKMESMDSKRLEIKEENPQPRPSSSSVDSSSKPGACSQTNTPNIPQSGLVSAPSSLTSSVAASLPVSLVTSVPTAAAAFPYTPYYPHLRPIQLDPMYRTLSPQIIGYAAAPPGYIHPTQLGYRMSVVEADRKSPDSVDALRGDAIVPGGGYAQVHKIHELHEKGRANSETRSSTTAKIGGGDNPPGPSTPGPPQDKNKEKQREYSSSPPTQRHVHTHHHTHVMSGFPTLYTPDAYSTRLT